MYSGQAGTELHNHGDDFLDDNELSNYLDNIDTGAYGLAVIYHFHDTGLGWKEMDILFLDEDGEVTDDSEELLDNHSYEKSRLGRTGAAF